MVTRRIKIEIPPENPNSKIPDNQPKPPVAKSDSDIAIGNSAYADGSADGQAGAPSMAVGNGAVAKGEGSVALGSKAVSDGMGGVAIGDAAKQKNGGISIGGNASAGAGGTIDNPFGGSVEINNSVAIGRDAKVTGGAIDSIAIWVPALLPAKPAVMPASWTKPMQRLSTPVNYPSVKKQKHRNGVKKILTAGSPMSPEDQKIPMPRILPS
ncbi:hypothetical protein ABN09_09175 [Morganella morganii]|nr:hypothetical protein ABN09_09175 [Morganella morganii]